MAKPVYRIMPTMRMAAGERAWSMDRDTEAMRRKSIEATTVMVKEMRRKKKYGPGSRRRFPMK